MGRHLASKATRIVALLAVVLSVLALGIALKSLPMGSLEPSALAQPSAGGLAATTGAADTYDPVPHGATTHAATAGLGLANSGGWSEVAAPIRAIRVAAKAVPEVGDTVLYQKLSSTGEHLKYGIAKNPATRYTSSELNGGRLNILARGSKPDMLTLERSLHKTLPIGPEEGQLFYIQKEVAQGLRPPPYLR